MQQYLDSTTFFDYEAPVVRSWADEVTRDCGKHPVELAKTLYLASRDEIRYNPYVCRPEKQTFSASHVLRTKESYCIPKAVLLGAVARYKGIPSRLGLADVKNHLSSPKLIEWLRSDVFRMHGYIELYLEGQWVKATPAFDSRLCRMMKVEALAFDGCSDSIFQSYTSDGSAHMEYLADHGQFADVPYDFIWQNLRESYGHLFEKPDQSVSKQRSLESDMRSNL